MVYSPLTSTKPIRLSNLLTFCGPVKNQQKPRCYTFKKKRHWDGIAIASRTVVHQNSTAVKVWLEWPVDSTCDWHLTTGPLNAWDWCFMVDMSHTCHLHNPSMQCCWQLESIMTVGHCWNSVECIPKDKVQEQKSECLHKLMRTMHSCIPKRWAKGYVQLVGRWARPPDTVCI